MSSTANRDPYYGYGPISILATSIVTALFPATVSPQEQTHALTESEQRMPQLVDFIAYALYRTRLSDAIVHSALLLLTRLKQRYPAARGTPSSPHRLFLSALMLASKMSMDDTYSNKSWVIVGQNMFTLSEVNRMERELFGFLNSNCYVTKDDLKSWCHEWCGCADEEDAEDVLFDDATHSATASMMALGSTTTGSRSSHSNSPISCSTTTTSSPSPRTPEEGSEGEEDVCNPWTSFNPNVGRIAPSNKDKIMHPAPHATASIHHILNSPV